MSLGVGEDKSVDKRDVYAISFAHTHTHVALACCPGFWHIRSNTRLPIAVYLTHAIAKVCPETCQLILYVK